MSRENFSIKKIFDSAYKLYQSGDLKGAEPLLKKNLESYPKHLPSIFLLGILSAQIKKYKIAKKLLKQAIIIKPDFTEGHNNLGNLFQELGEYQEAISCYQHSIKLNPKHVEAYYNLGKVFQESGKEKEAVSSYQKAIQIDSNYIKAHSSLGNLFQELGEYQEAISCYQHMIRLNPGHANAHYNLGTAFHEINKYHDAIPCYQNAIKIDSHNAKFYYNLACAETELGEYYSAIENFKKALSISNDYTAAKYNLARLYLATENFSKGWRGFEMRWEKIDELFSKKDSDRVPQRVKNIIKLKQWDGKKFDGTLFVHGEQGIGDIIIHSSIISDLLKIQPNIYLTVQERLVSLYKRSFNKIKISNYDAQLNYKDNDCHIGIASLGSFLRQSINDFPKQPPAYIFPDFDRVNDFKKLLNRNKKIKIGLSWTTKGSRSSKRTISLNQMARLLTLQDVEFVNLQYGDTSEERKKFKKEFGIEIINFDNLDLMSDFESLSALIASCDLVITITNITSQFSGAIGKKTWVIVPIYTQWNWFHERDNSLWYPNVKLFRQQQYGIWEDVIDKIYYEITKIGNDKIKA